MLFQVQIQPKSIKSVSVYGNCGETTQVHYMTMLYNWLMHDIIIIIIIIINTESEVFAIQDQAVKTKYIEKHIYSTREDDKCWLCNEYKETIHHITSGCPIYAQRENERKI